jgi:peptide/nickel transport system permease protein
LLEPSSAPAVAVPASRRRTRRRRGQPWALRLSVGFIALVVLLAILAPVLSTLSPTQRSGEQLLAPGSAGHLLGTDALGRDQLTRLLYGARPLLLTSTMAVLAATVIGTALGMLAGYARGFVEGAILRLLDVLLSFPLFLFGIIVVAALGSGTVNLAAAVAIALLPVIARLAHGLTLREASREYVLAARSTGARPGRILLREILPNIAGPIVVQATSLFALAAGFATALSYLGLGVIPPTPDWGLMVRDGQDFISTAPDLAVIPGAAITLLLVAITLVGDGLRDRMDPGHRLRAITAP